MFVKAGGTKKASARLKLLDASVTYLKIWVVGTVRLHPVTCGGETNTLSTVLEREHLSSVDPSNWCPGKAIHANEDVSQSDDSLGRSAGDGPPQNVVSCSWLVLEQDFGAGYSYHLHCRRRVRKKP